ncbi:GNAT family protein [Trinickia caryophylli]|uniref:Protein N-acetyltransferase, RimJ/RimL family n=1 Tax=Trinickia caryophylli TaxID=28094 RepID=A0A1X7D086_TRICW|nr:GNAT family protein [Trinickia caryophylli]PMS13541.1 N-acetyltransferase [Trinickia caryophylli]TRX15813.1 GNAT family N-acetyltransferase [Trinickia caryophylli]WQE15172.1 GNAT family protein [Trinickia caryophylli]SMF06296.1 Protein N-acetyltransferase, RimJ/RimL family [Trinickia caryophylli]GLU31088.1 acetyltransferase [Trinickia caryophylli]
MTSTLDHTDSAPRTNEFGQPIGPAVPGWQARERPPRTAMTGHRVRLEPLDAARHGAALYAAYAAAADTRDWTYMNAGPFADEAALTAHLTRAAASEDPLHFAIVDLASGQPAGTFALMRVDCANGVVEVGHVTYSPRLQRSAVATEAMYLLMRRVFDELGYRRFEWKCDSLNARSRAAVLRYGFAYEGIFRQAIVYKGRSRDTAWFSLLDHEWPAVRAGFEHWLAPGNFDAEGRQHMPLAESIARSRASGASA